MYSFECICGNELKTPVTAGVCPHCGRQFQLDWHGDYDGPPARPQAPKAIAAAAA